MSVIATMVIVAATTPTMLKSTKNYRPVVPVEYHADVLYENTSPEVWSKVKVEKTDRSEFRANLKAKKYVGKERVESTAFDSDEGKWKKLGRPKRLGPG